MKIRLADIDLARSENYSRRHIDPESCRGLAESMDEIGQRHAVGVIPLEGGKFQLVYGFRRYTAANLLGWLEINATKSPEGDEALDNLVENIARKGLTYWDEIQAVKSAFPDGVSINRLAKVLGQSRTWARNRLNVWELGDEILQMIERDELDVSDAMLLMKEGPEKAKELAQRKQAGESATSRTGKNTRTKDELRRGMTQVFDTGRQDWIAIFRFALCEIDNDELSSILEQYGQETPHHSS